jgi:AbrB family looped-hinge helix DNA binding protein
MPVTVSEKGWVAIPAHLRKKDNLHPGAEVSVVDYAGVLTLIPPALPAPRRAWPRRPRGPRRARHRDARPTKPFRRA